MANPVLREEVETSELVTLESSFEVAIQKIAKNASAADQARIRFAREVFDTDIETLYVHVALRYRPDSTHEYLADKLGCTVDEIEAIASKAETQIAEANEETPDQPKFIGTRRVMSPAEVARKLIASRTRKQEVALDSYFAKAVAERESLTGGTPPAPSTYRRNGVTLDVTASMDQKPAPFTLEPAEENGKQTCVIVGTLDRVQLKAVDFTLLKTMKPGQYVTTQALGQAVYPGYSSAKMLVSQSQTRLKIAFVKASGSTTDVLQSTRGKGVKLALSVGAVLTKLAEQFAQKAAEVQKPAAPVAAKSKPAAKPKQALKSKAKTALKNAAKKPLKKTVQKKVAPKKKPSKTVAKAKTRRPARPGLRR